MNSRFVGLWVVFALASGCGGGDAPNISDDDAW